MGHKAPQPPPDDYNPTNPQGTSPPPPPKRAPGERGKRTSGMRMIGRALDVPNNAMFTVEWAVGEIERRGHRLAAAEQRAQESEETLDDLRAAYVVHEAELSRVHEAELSRVREDKAWFEQTCEKQGNVILELQKQIIDLRDDNAKHTAERQRVQGDCAELHAELVRLKAEPKLVPPGERLTKWLDKVAIACGLPTPSRRGGFTDAFADGVLEELENLPENNDRLIVEAMRDKHVEFKADLESKVLVFGDGDTPQFVEVPPIVKADHKRILIDRLKLYREVRALTDRLVILEKQKLSFAQLGDIIGQDPNLDYEKSCEGIAEALRQLARYSAFYHNHYPKIAGTAICHQNLGEEKAADGWNKVASDLFLAAHLD